MTVSIGEHITLLCYSFFVGAFLGALYDAVRLLRTFLGLGIDYADSSAISRIDPPIIGKRKKREQRRTGRAAVTAVIFVFDILYMAAATAVTVIFVYHAYSGTPRGFALLGELFGFYLYMKTAGKVTSAAASYIFFFSDTAVRYIVYFTVTPLMIILKCVSKLAVKVYRVTVERAVRSVIMKKSSARERRYIDRELHKIFADAADAVAREDTE